MRCGFENGRKCAALRRKKGCEDCSFLKTAKEIKKGRQAAVKRLKRIGLYEWATMHYPELITEFLGQ